MTRTAPRQCDSEAELELLSPTDNVDTNINGDSTLRMADVAATLSLLLGVPLPRHNEGAFLTRMFRNVRRERWPLHMQDLLYQRWWYTQTYLQARGARFPTRRLRVEPRTPHLYDPASHLTRFFTCSWRTWAACSLLRPYSAHLAGASARPTLPLRLFAVHGAA